MVSLSLLSLSQGLFLELIDMLAPRGVVLPSQLTSSPHVALLRQRRQERERERGRKTRRNQQINYYDQLSSLYMSILLMEYI